MTDAPQNQPAFPLAWPAGWPRTEQHRRAAAPFYTVTFGEMRAGGYKPRYKRDKSMSDATEEVLSELRQLGATRIVISTNVELRQDGLPFANRRPPDDAGVAVYFRIKDRPVVLAADKWKRVEDNLYAVAMHISALRGQQRWGVGSVEKAFAGYAALAAPGQSGAPTWWHMLNVAHDCTFEQARAAYREKARASHPDTGGSQEAMTTLNTAWDQCRRHFDSKTP